MKVRSLSQLKAKLQQWRERFEKAVLPHFHCIVGQFWRFLNDTPTIALLMEPLKLSHMGKHYANLLTHEKPVDIEQMPGTEIENAARAYHVIMDCAQKGGFKHPKEKAKVEQEIARHFHPTPGHATDEWMRDYLRNAFIEPLLSHVEDGLENNSIILSLLRRYKAHCEWFDRLTLTNMIEGGPCKYGAAEGKNNTGEWFAKLHLYEYLHANGVIFTIDPYSDVGKPDLVGQGKDDPLIADAKSFEGRRKPILEGFGQVYRYVSSFNETFGYLVIFNTTDKPIQLELDGSLETIHFATFSGRTVYFVVIDTFPKPVQASVAGKLAPAVKITKDELVKIVNDPQATMEDAGG
jgi:hypothetical protein